MRDNTVKLAAGKPLHERLAGSDELAELDEVFHGMADSLDEASEAKQELFNMVTHDIRTPLGAVQGCLEILDVDSHENSMPESTRKLVTVALRNGSRAMALINDLLDSEKIKSGMMVLETEEINLENAFEEIRLNFADLLGEYRIALDVQSTDIQVQANQALLSRILFNLVTNAIKYSPVDSTIAVRAEARGPMAEITVSDQGLGIPKHLQKAIFQKFRQLEAPGEKPTGGSGLGLAICQDFVSLHGGTIWVTSQTNKGSTFHFTVPLS